MRRTAMTRAVLAATHLVANESFAYAAVTAGSSGVTPEQGRVGTLAVLKTNAAYLAGSL